MALDFWKRLKKPLMVLAPMADVTDAAFREIIAKYGKPDVLWTEFTSADGLTSAGKEKLLHNLKYTEQERPIVAQFFTAKPDKMREVAILARELGFDGIDINMGCPDRAILKQGAGGALIKTPKLACELIASAQEGAQGIPVSIKTRLGYSKDTLEEWLPILLKTDVSAISIHARTVKELSKVPARWERIKRAVEIREEIGSQTLIIGNGDVHDIHDAYTKSKETGADGVMFGRAIFGNPWLFSKPIREVSVAEKLEVLVEHTKLFEKYFKNIKSFAVMKKHFKAYANGFDGARDLRVELMERGNSAENVAKIVAKWVSQERLDR